MTIEQIRKELDKVENTIFYIDMINHWTPRDRERMNNVKAKRRELLSLLDKAE